MRTANIDDKLLEQFRRKEFHNPLFNLLTNEFDSWMLDQNLSDDYVVKHLYVESKTEGQTVREKFYDLWTKNSVNNESQGLVYLLLGKKGGGKTVTVNRFSLDVKERMANPNVIYLDLKTKKSDNAFIQNLPASLMEEIYSKIEMSKKDNLHKYLMKPESMRELDERWQYFKDDTVAKIVIEERERTMEKLFNHLQEKQTVTYLIIDNIDDFPMTSIQSIIDKCVELMQKYKVRAIVALRDYWNPKFLKRNDKNICSRYLPEPDILEILIKRLNSIPVNNIKDGYEMSYGKHKLENLTAEDIIKTFHCVVENITKDKELHKKLYRLSNYDTREHLFNMYHFFHSPYLYSKPMFVQVLIDKIKQVKPDLNLDSARDARFFDFIECAMAIHFLCYDIGASKIFNIFFHDYPVDKNVGDYNYRNTLIYVRILQSIGRGRDKETIIYELTSIGYKEDALRDAIGVLLENALIESFQGIAEKDADEISISAKGQIYLEELIYEYSYLVFVCDAVPMPEDKKVNITDKFGENDAIPFSRGSLEKKTDSVYKFIDFITEEEEEEENLCPSELKVENGLLASIRGEKGISGRMRECVESTERRMKKYGQRNTLNITINKKI